MHLALLPVVKDFLGKELSATAVDEVVEDAKEEEGALEGKVDEGPVNGRGGCSMLLGVGGGWHPRVGGARI